MAAGTRKQLPFTKTLGFRPDFWYFVGHGFFG